jgi:hypothetical protein
MKSSLIRRIAAALAATSALLSMAGCVSAPEPAVLTLEEQALAGLWKLDSAIGVELTSGLNYFSNLVLSAKFACTERYPTKQYVSKLIAAGFTIRINANGGLALGSIPEYADYYFTRLD